MQRDAAALKAALADLEQRQLKRTRRLGLAPGLVNFCSNDYLGLANHPEVTRVHRDGVAAWRAAAPRIWSRVMARNTRRSKTNSPPSRGREKALVFSTGYMANMGVIGALADQKAAIVSDKLNHASLIDGCRLQEPRFGAIVMAMPGMPRNCCRRWQPRPGW